jgi:hypothetical protein
VPMPRKTLERREPLARNDISSLKKKHVREKVARRPLEAKQALQAPMSRSATDQRLEGWQAQTPRWPQTQKTEPPRRCPARPY